MTATVEQKTFRKLFLILAMLTVSSRAFAWGERGHHLICETATRLVRDPQLARFLVSRGDLMGHVCNIPDISWRSLGPSAKAGDAGHFLNPENIDTTVQDLPLDLAKTFKRHEGKPSEYLGRTVNVSEDLGSLWWRADQFFRRAIDFGKAAAKVKLALKEDRPVTTPEYDAAVYSFMESMGLMGHFVGDASMPYHNSADYDGWKTGHGGIHGYYESECVDREGFDLIEKVFEAAKKLPVEKLGGKSTAVVARMKALSLASQKEIPDVEALDKVLAPSKLVTDANGKVSKIKAKRPDPKDRAAAFEPLIVGELARSASLLAQLWDAIYEESGEPDLSAYRSYKYPLDPAFVPLDYLPESPRR